MFIIYLINKLLFFRPNEIIQPQIKLSSCIESFKQSEIIQQFFNTALNQRTTAQKYVKFVYLYYISLLFEYLYFHN